MSVEADQAVDTCKWIWDMTVFQLIIWFRMLKKILEGTWLQTLVHMMHLQSVDWPLNEVF